MSPDCLQFLLTHQYPDGGWGYQSGSPGSVEATSWALLALARRGGTTLRSKMRAPGRVPGC
jgi:hypothetical protein